MAASRILRALPAAPLSLAPAYRLVIATPAARRTYSAAANTTATITDTPTATPTTTSAASPLPQAPPAATPSTAAATQVDARAGRRGELNYFVARTPSNKLPIYEDTQRGPRTLLRKIEGNSAALRLELVRLLQLDDEKVLVNPRTNHIRIKPNWRPFCKKWASEDPWSRDSACFTSGSSKRMY
ncbi:hypothetical protein RB598_003577 [Gaeumannomyces tritici]